MHDTDCCLLPCCPCHPQPKEEAYGSSTAARRFLVLYAAAAKQGEAVPLCLPCNVQQRQPLVLMSPRLGGKDERHVSMSSQRPTAHALPNQPLLPIAALLPTAELPGEREYLCRLAAARTAAAAARAVEEESTSAAITAEGGHASCACSAGGRRMQSLTARPTTAWHAARHGPHAMHCRLVPVHLAHSHHLPNPSLSSACALPTSQAFVGWLQEQPPSGIVSAALATARGGLDALRCAVGALALHASVTCAARPACRHLSANALESPLTVRAPTLTAAAARTLCSSAVSDQWLPCWPPCSRALLRAMRARQQAHSRQRAVRQRQSTWQLQWTTCCSSRISTATPPCLAGVWLDLDDARC